MKKITLLLTAVFVLSAASMYAQQRVSRDGLGQLLYQMYFAHVPENEFNQVFQNFMRSNYSGKDNFNADEVRAITSGFVFFILNNDAVSDKWQKYADADKARKAEQQQVAKSYIDSGKDAYESKDYDKAITFFSQAIRIDSNNSDVYWRRGNAYKNKGDYDKAIADYTEAIRLNHRFKTFVYSSRAEAYNGKGDYDKAIADCNEAIKLGVNIHAYLNRSFAYMQKGNFTQARADVDKMLREAPDYQEAKDRDAELKEKGY